MVDTVDVAADGPLDGQLSVLGLDPEVESYYREILLMGGGSLAEVTSTLGLPADPRAGVLGRMTEAGVVTVRGGRVEPLPPSLALEPLVLARVRRLRDDQDEIAAARTAIEQFSASVEAGVAHGSVPAQVEIINGRHGLGVLAAMPAATTGEMLFVRRHWHLVDPAVMNDEGVDREIAGGRRVRALYDDATVANVPGFVRRRSEMGEEVRVLGDVPARMAVFGTDVAFVPEGWDDLRGGRVVIREPGVVLALRAMFDAMWARGRAPFGRIDTDDGRAALLGLLAEGAKDEHVARTMALSLRTVRRRIAELMTETGATSRFQLGAEAVRRGWV